MRETATGGGRGSAAMVGMVVVLVLAAALVGAAIADPGGLTPWAGAIDSADRALGRGDGAGAERTLQTAYSAALKSRTWESMVDVGDAYRRMVESAGPRGRAETRAREAYLAALFRARQQGSLAGVFRTAEGFAALGDREPVNMCITVARALAARIADTQERERAYASVERVAHRLLALETTRPE